jgi:glycosyltransferase involved in cell wall biosynthesis
VSTLPFASLADERGTLLRHSVVTGPVRTRAEAATLSRLRARGPLVGLTGFLDFPRYREPGDERDYVAMCAAWCHCFREPGDILGDGTPRLLLAHSDFLDWRLAGAQVAAGRRRDFDFVYVCQAGPAKELVKGWELARRCLPVLTGELGLRGLLIGRRRIRDLTGDPSRLVVVGALPWRAMMRAFAQARFLFVPNGLDPSPRILAEALALDTPVVVNRKILGGWHYVNPFTGAFFDDERDIADAVRRCFEQPLSPRRWFAANHGPLNAGRRLRGLIAASDRAVRARAVHIVPFAR